MVFDKKTPHRCKLISKSTQKLALIRHNETCIYPISISYGNILSNKDDPWNAINLHQKACKKNLSQIHDPHLRCSHYNVFLQSMIILLTDLSKQESKNYQTSQKIDALSVKSRVIASVLSACRRASENITMHAH